MSDRMEEGMAEALRLTRAGRLDEATAIIQRTLRQVPIVDGSAAESGGADEPIEAEFRAVEDPPPSKETPVRDRAPSTGAQTGTAAAHPPAAPGVLSPGAKRMPGSRRSGTGGEHTVTSEEASFWARAGERFVDGTYSGVAGKRNYKLYIPSAYRGQSLPLLVMLHGFSKTPVDLA